MSLLRDFQVNDLISMDSDAIVAALDASGYPGNEVIDPVFVSLSYSEYYRAIMAHYQFHYNDVEGLVVSDVYIRYENNKLVAEY